MAGSQVPSWCCKSSCNLTGVALTSKGLRIQKTKLTPLLGEAADDAPPKCHRQRAAGGQAGGHLLWGRPEAAVEGAVLWSTLTESGLWAGGPQAGRELHLREHKQEQLSLGRGFVHSPACARLRVGDEVERSLTSGVCIAKEVHCGEYRGMRLARERVSRKASRGPESRPR